MKLVLVVLCLILVAPFVFSLSPNDFDLYNVNNDETVSFYVRIPEMVFENTPFEILVIPDPTAESGDLNLKLSDGKNTLNYTSSMVDFQGETEYLVNWTVEIDEYTEYELFYEEGLIKTFDFQPIIKTVIDRKIRESIYFPQKVTDNQREHLIELLAEQDYDLTLEQFILEEKKSQELITLDKKVFVETLVYNDNSTFIQTVVVIDLLTDVVVSDIKIIETIPKDFAFSVKNIIFEGEQPIILEDDPKVMWHLQGVDDSRIQYAVEGNHTLTGNTILLTTVIEESEKVTSSNGSGKIILPLLLIPLVAGIIIFFSKFSKAPKKRKSHRKK